MVERVTADRDAGSCSSKAIGSVDETGCPRRPHTPQSSISGAAIGQGGQLRGERSPGLQRRRIPLLLDSDLFLPRPGRTISLGERRQVFLRRPLIAPSRRCARSDPSSAGQRRSGGGVDVDEHYGQSYDFLDGLDALVRPTWQRCLPASAAGRYIPSWFTGPCPGLASRRPKTADSARGGRCAGSQPVKDLLRHSPAMRDQPWTAIHIRTLERTDGSRGQDDPLLDAARWITTRAHWLIAARNPEEPETIKFFVSNAPAGTLSNGWRTSVIRDGQSSGASRKTKTNWASIISRFADGRPSIATCTSRRSAICI